MSGAMSSPNAWLFSSDNSRYSTRARLLFMALSFAIGILTFLLYLALWFLCSRRRRRQRAAGWASSGAAAGQEDGCDGGGMSGDAIAALPTFVVVAVAQEPETETDTAALVDCPVCLGQVEAGEKARRLPKCGHSFHAECVDAWLRAHSTCPMCRAAVGPAAAATATKIPAAAADTTTTTTTVATPAPPAPAAADALPPV